MKAGAGRSNQARITDLLDPRNRRNAQGKAGTLDVELPLRYSDSTGRLELKRARAVAVNRATSAQTDSTNATKSELLTVIGTAGTVVFGNGSLTGPATGFEMQVASGATSLYLTWLIPTDIHVGRPVTLTVHFFSDATESSQFVEFEASLRSHTFGDVVDPESGSAVNSGDVDWPASGGSNFTVIDITNNLDANADAALIEISRTSSSNDPAGANDPFIYMVVLTYHPVPSSASTDPELTALRAEMAALKQTLRDGGFLEK